MPSKKKYEKPLTIDATFDEAIARYAQTDPAELRQVVAEDTEPLKLWENVETGDKFVLFSKPDGANLQLRFENAEPWATRKQMADLFGVKTQTIDYHVKKIYENNELVDPDSTTKESLVVGVNGQSYTAEIYNLDVVLEVGHRVNSKQGILFRRWARGIERQYLLKGFVIDAPRLKDPDRNDHLEDLLEEIADIRSSEANVWKRVLELISKCSDYYAMTDDDKSDYFATFQNTVHWAVTSSTAAHIISDRSDASKPHAGLTTFDGLEKGCEPRAEDMTVAKNYYFRDEIGRLRMITNLALDFLASQAEQGRLVTVAQYTAKLRELVKLDGRPLIQEGYKGEISKPVADKKAKRELAVYKRRIRMEKETGGEREIEDLLKEARRMVDEKAKKSKAPKRLDKKG